MQDDESNNKDRVIGFLIIVGIIIVLFFVNMKILESSNLLFIVHEFAVIE